MTPESFSGIWPAMLTPLAADLAIDADRFALHARTLLAAGCGGMTPFGTTGEGPSFSVDERRAPVDALVAGGVPAARILVSHRLRRRRDDGAESRAGVRPVRRAAGGSGRADAERERAAADRAARARCAHRSGRAVAAGVTGRGAIAGMPTLEQVENIL
jgi:hypothetical protein